MKKVFVLLFSYVITLNAFAQDNSEENSNKPHGFRKDNIFLGGSISLGFGSGSFGVGANPEIGYTIAQWLDAGLVFNVNYNSQKYDYNYDYNYDGKFTSFNYGGGAFFRAYPVHFLFLQGQLEQNWIAYKDKNFGNGLSGKTTVDAASFLGGVGYTQRDIGRSSFYTVLLFDLMRNKNSPYRDAYNDAIPIIRAGFNVYLHPSKNK